jgi:hypothetical protein
MMIITRSAPFSLHKPTGSSSGSTMLEEILIPVVLVLLAIAALVAVAVRKRQQKGGRKQQSWSKLQEPLLVRKERVSSGGQMVEMTNVESPQRSIPKVTADYSESG